MKFFGLLRSACNRVLLVPIVCLGLKPTPLLAQARPVAGAGVRVSAVPAPAAHSSSRELARKIAESIDAGDLCPSVNGPVRLRRVPGKVVVPLAPEAAVTQRWSGPGRPLAGYRILTRPARDLAILAAPEEETQRQRTEPARLRQSLASARAQVSGANVNPVFLDPVNGLELIATDRLVISLKPGVDARRYFGRAWKQVKSVWGATNEFLLTLPGMSAERVFAEAERRRQQPAVAWVEPDFVRQAVKSLTPNDPDFATKQWNLSNTGQGGGRPGADAKLPAAWDLVTGNPNIVIAILDDGVQIAHPDLAPSLFLNTNETPNNGVDDDHNGVIDDLHGYNFFSGSPDPSPTNLEDSHGTCVAGIAAAAGNNSQGVAGAAYGCRLLPLKIIEGEYLVSDSTLAAALRYAAGLGHNGQPVWRGADVLNLSLLFSPSFVINSAFTDAATRGRNGLGCGIFAAAGNFASAWQPYELTLTQAGTHTLRWEYTKDGSRSDGDDTVWIDGLTYPDGTTESFQNGLPAGWTTGGAAPWTSVTEGVNGNRGLVGWDGQAARSLRAGAINANQTTYVEVIKTIGPGVLRFWAWVSTERNYDIFTFSVDGDSVFTDSGVPLPDTAVGYPASHAACFAVGASTDFDYRADYSQYGIALDFLAPSDGGASTIFTTDRTGVDGYNTAASPAGDYAADFGGTSAASPLAAGVAALIYSANPYLTSGDLRALMRATCDKIGGVTYDSAGRNFFYGSGRVNAARAVSQAKTDVRVTVVTSASFANVGDATTYTVSVQNISLSHSGPITLTNQLPAGVTYGSATPAPSSQSGARLVFSVPSLGADEIFTATVRVTNTLAGINVFLAGATAAALESDLSNNTNSASQAIYPLPTVSIADATVLEGNSGTTNALFAVTLSNPSSGPVSVGFATVTNTALAGTDYTATRGVLSFAPGETNKTIAVRVIGDTKNEGDDSFWVVLTNAVRATLGRAAAAGVILNDDPLPTLSITNLVVTEGNSGLRKATFKVVLAPVSGRLVTVDYATAPGTAVDGVDFLSTNGSLIFLPGKTTQKIVVPVVGDKLQESNLTFLVNLSNPVHATLGHAQGIGTILNNDKPPRVFINDVTVTEGDIDPTNALFQVRLSTPSGLPVSLTFTTTNGSATSGLDYVATNGLILFTPGQTNQTIAIPVLGDLLSESNETFSVLLGNLTNALAGDLVGLATVQDNDPLPSLTVQTPAAIAEPSVGTTNLTFVVSLSQPSGRTVVVKYATANGSAVAGADFVARSGSLLFPPGTTTQFVDVAIRSDALAEPLETFSLTLTAPVNATLNVSSAEGQIIDASPARLLAAASNSPGPFLEATVREATVWIRFLSKAGDHYALEWTDGEGLSEGRWQPVAGAADVLGTGQPIELTDPDSVGRPNGFYRVRQLR